MGIILKDGSEIFDKRLGRLINFDERSRLFGIEELYGAKKQRSYTWRCNEWLDQGREGACVAFALGHELVSRPAEVKGVNYKWLVEQVYWEAQKTDPWPGGSYPGASPRYDGTSVLAAIKILHKKNFFKEYRWCFQLKDVIDGIGHNGPAVAGFRWYADMANPDGNGFISPTGSLLGGHAILIKAVNVKQKFFTIRNSWGKSWGFNGDCYITFDNLEKLLYSQGEVAFLVGRTAKVQIN